MGRGWGGGTPKIAVERKMEQGFHSGGFDVVGWHFSLFAETFLYWNNIRFLFVHLPWYSQIFGEGGGGKGWGGGTPKIAMERKMEQGFHQCCRKFKMFGESDDFEKNVRVAFNIKSTFDIE